MERACQLKDETVDYLLNPRELTERDIVNSIDANLSYEDIRKQCPQYSGVESLRVAARGHDYPDLRMIDAWKELGLTKEFKAAYRTKHT